MILFAHVSDLHFGAELANKTPGTTLHQDPHSLILCLALPSAFDDARALNGLRQDAPVNVVASGDLTLSGSSEEFSVRTRLPEVAPANQAVTDRGIHGTRHRRRRPWRGAW